MSGGSMDYAFTKVEDAAGLMRPTTLLRRAFRVHLLNVARALKAIEWNDSGDGDDEEDQLIRACLPEAVSELRTAIGEAVAAQGLLEKSIIKALEIER